MKLERKRELCRLIRDANIHFHERESVLSGHHTHVFDAIRELGRYRFQDYSPPFTHEAHEKPWRVTLKAHVQRIVSLAETCIREQQNEYGWRLRLEHEIFARFSTEVTCKRCSCRLWRSEVEVLLDPRDSYGKSLGLAKRQASRKPCTCKDFQRHLDREDSGISRLFHDRADAAVKYPQRDLIADLLPAEQKPDRVFGYHETSRFAKLLKQQSTIPGKDDQMIRDILECSPFDEPRDQVLFPFLVLESKSDNGDSFSTIETQTAFVIKKLLDIQHTLKSTADGESQWDSGPLVWFLSHRGDEWRVAAAYPQQEGSFSTLHYHIYQLWSGSIRSTDGSLQLLLIMDYIWDWARDSHREAILGELRVLAGKTGSNFSDSDVHSLGDRMAVFLDTDSEQCVPGSFSLKDGPHYSPDANKIVFRSISHVRARLLALQVTRETFELLKLSFDSAVAAKERANEILALLNHAWKVSSNTLEALEFMWTGQRRDDAGFHGADMMYHAVFTVRAYLASDWEHVLELTYIAIADNALTPLQSFARPHQPIPTRPSQMGSICQGDLLAWFRRFRQSPPRIRLHAAMRRACFSSQNCRQARCWITAEGSVEHGYLFRTVMVTDDVPKSCEVVTAVYNLCRKGMREPEEPFLRNSSFFGTTSSDQVELGAVWNLDGCPFADAALLALLLPPRTTLKAHENVCIYVLNDVPGPQTFHINPLALAVSAFQLHQRQLRKTYLACHGRGFLRQHVLQARWNVTVDNGFAPAPRDLWTALNRFKKGDITLKMTKSTCRLVNNTADFCLPLEKDREVSKRSLSDIDGCSEEKQENNESGVRTRRRFINSN